MNTKILAVLGSGAAAVLLSACGGDDSLSGRYSGDVMGSRMDITFIDDSRATFGPGGAGEDTALDCTYQVGETLITLSCVGSSGISLTRVDGGLEANMGGLLVQFDKQ